MEPGAKIHKDARGEVDRWRETRANSPTWTVNSPEFYLDKIVPNSHVGVKDSHFGLLESVLL